MHGTRGAVFAIFLGFVAVAFFGVLTAYSDHGATSVAAALSLVKQTCDPCYNAVRKLYSAVVRSELLSWHFYALVGIILLFEWILPVYRRSQVFAASFLHDFLWFLLDVLFVGVLLPIYQTLLSRIYHSSLGFLEVDIIKTWPLAGQILVAVFVADLIRWFHHLVRHKVTLFWYFHTVHHSQRDMNPFTDLRVHPVERLIEVGISFIPFLSLRTDIALASFSGWNMFGIWYARFYHSNVKTNLGILRYMMVTPQSHRIHHSRQKEHRDKNFGAIFSIWDHLFGTQYRKYDEYPETGIDDPFFPHESESGWHKPLGSLTLQLIYPFRQAYRSVIPTVLPNRTG
jgi:sterol desaturase/sphingolipid hydroxylase (fatty acid hydroxylase superfamily)